MRKYLILASADVSKPQQLAQSASASTSSASANAQHRNITVDSDDPADTINYNYNEFTKIGSMKLILKEIFPKASEELITAFEYEGRLCGSGSQPSIDPNSLVGKVLQVNGGGSSEIELCRGILLLQCDQCQIVGGLAPTNRQNVMDDLFDDEDLLDLSFV